MPYVRDVCYVDTNRIEREVANTETLAMRAKWKPKVVVIGGVVGEKKRKRVK